MWDVAGEAHDVAGARLLDGSFQERALVPLSDDDDLEVGVEGRQRSGGGDHPIELLHGHEPTDGYDEGVIRLVARPPRPPPTCREAPVDPGRQDAHEIRPQAQRVDDLLAGRAREGDDTAAPVERGRQP